MKAKIGAVLIALFLISVVSAEYSIDISGLKESYSVGEEINFKVILLEDGKQISGNAGVVLSDSLGKKKIEKTVQSGEDNTILILPDFPSLRWNIKATYEDAEVERNFLIKENTKVEFSIEADKLIIRNIGNTRYTRTIYITIGDNPASSLAQNIKVGEQKELKLIAPKGQYDIEITDGEITFDKKSVQLFGTGNAVGAIDPNLQGTGLLGGPVDPDNLDEGFFSTTKLPVALVFIAAVFGLGVLLLIEKRVKKRG